MGWSDRVRGRGKEQGGRTNLIHLDDIEFGAEFREEGFGGAAVGAVGFGEDGCGLFVSICLFGEESEGWDGWMDGEGGWYGGWYGVDGKGEGERGRDGHTNSVLVNDTLGFGLCGGHGGGVGGG